MMSSFTSPLDLRVLGKWEFEILAPFEFHVGEYPSDEIISVPSGFVTDFASIPRIFWSILSPIDEYGKAAVLHDYLYHTGMFSKKRTESIFKEAMEVLKTPRWKIRTIFIAVSLFGFHAWNKNRKKESS